MTIQRTSTLIALSAVIFMVTSTNIQAGTTFRGVQKFQTNGNGANNDLVSPVLDRDTPFHIDVFDGFGRSAALDNSRDNSGDGFHVGLVPTADGSVAFGDADANSGIWTAGSEYSADGGSLSRGGSDQSLAILPWRVSPGLGDDYLVAADITIGIGSTVNLAYAGADNGSSDLSSALGQLVVALTRTDATTIQYVLDWFTGVDPQSGDALRVSPLSSPGDLVALQADLDDGISVQLGWKDRMNGDDLYDLYVDAGNGSNARITGSMGVGIDVHSIAIELADANAYVDSVTAAVPEPTSGLLMLLGLVSIFVNRSRRNS